MKVLLLGLALSPVAVAAQPAMTAEDFLRRMAEDTIADVEAGRMAQGTETAPGPVRQLGRQITGEAIQLNGRLSRLAGPRGVRQDNQIAAEDRQALERLSRLQGTPFAREYLRYVMADLERDRALLQVATALDDRPVADFARETLARVDSDLMVARTVYDAQVASNPER